MTPILSVQNLTLRRGSTIILEDVNWTVEPGQNWVILGPNGCGKTSLLNVLSGYLHATSGTISVLGETFGESDWRELRERIGIVSATVAELLDPEDPAVEIVIGGKFAMAGIWGRVTDDERHEALGHLTATGAEHLADRPWQFLSQGERQRVLIARALMAHPRLLILDEPCAGLDPVAREHFLASIESLAGRSESPGLVLVTHHVEEIIPAFSHALLIANGHVTASGSISRNLTTGNLSRTFGAPLRLSRRAGRFALQVS